MRIGIIGAGAIGCYVGGRLIAAGTEVVMVGRARLAAELAAHGLTFSDFGGPQVRLPPDRVVVATEVDALAGCDVILCCVKSAQTAEVARDLARVAPRAVVASLQNGVRNPEILRGAGLTVIAGIVSFNVVARGDGVFHRATSGPIMLETRTDDPLVRELARAGIEVETRGDLAPDQWTKLLVNLGNAVSALSGAPTREILLTPGYRKVVAALVEEAHEVLHDAGMRPARLRGVPVRLMPTVLRLPTALVRLVTRAQMKVDPEARSSMWQDLDRGRPTEVEYLNGEIVRIAERVGRAAPLNRRMVELVHDAERDGPGSPNLDAVTLWSRLVR